MALSGVARLKANKSGKSGGGLKTLFSSRVQGKGKAGKGASKILAKRGKR